MKEPGRKLTEPVERDERLYDEKVRLVRPGRLIAGFAMIGVAIIWLVVENVVSPAPPRPPVGAVATAGPNIPRIAMAQSFEGGVADVVVQTRQARLNGRAAPKGSSFLVLAVQVVNRSQAALPVAVSDFTLRFGARKTAGGIAAAGHAALFSHRGIPPQATSEGDIEFTVPNGASSLTVVYVPRVPGAKPLKWLVAGEST